MRENLARDAKNYHTWDIGSGVGAFRRSHPPVPLDIDRESRSWTISTLVGRRGGVRRRATPAGRTQQLGMEPPLCSSSSAGSVSPVQSSPSTSTQPCCNRWKDDQVRKGLCKSIPRKRAQQRFAWTYLRALHTALPPTLQTKLGGELAWVKDICFRRMPRRRRTPSVDTMGRGPGGALEWWLDCIAEQAKSGQGG